MGDVPVNLVHREVYRVQPDGLRSNIKTYSKSRVCKSRGCGTKLTMYNGTCYCCACRERNIDEQSTFKDR